MGSKRAKMFALRQQLARVHARDLGARGAWLAGATADAMTPELTSGGTRRRMHAPTSAASSWGAPARVAPHSMQHDERMATTQASLASTATRAAFASTAATSIVGSFCDSTLGSTGAWPQGMAVQEY